MGKARGSADRVLDVVCVGLVRASDELEKWVRLAKIKLNILHKSVTLKTECDMLQNICQSKETQKRERCPKNCTVPDFIFYE